MTKNSYGSLETGTENERSLRMTGQTGNDEGVKGVKKETSRKVVRKNNRNTNRKPVGIRKKVADPRNIPLPEEDTVKIDTTRKGQTANKSAKAGKNAKAVPAEKVKNPDVNKREAKRSQRSENSGKRSKPGDSRQKLSIAEQIESPGENINITPGKPEKNPKTIRSSGKEPGADSESGAKTNSKIRIIPLGGLNEVGKNMTVVEFENDIIVIDCGLGFPDEDMPGVDLVIPDITYLEANVDRIRGIVLTHGHEDHIGAIPYVLRSVNVPIYGTKLTLGIVRNKLKEFSLPGNPKLVCVAAGDTVRLGKLSVEFIHVNHSIADACALAIKTPLGTLVHSGDFKLDLTPIDGEVMDIARFGELGKEGVLLLMCESTNAERPGNTPSERKVGSSLEYIFTVNEEKRIVIATFSSNVHRVQQIIDISANHGRKVAITGRSMLNIIGAAVELGYMHVPQGVIIDISEIKKYRPEELTLVTTGSQGEPMSALYRMAFGEHRDVTLVANDLVVLSSSAIPGNEKLVGRIVNELCKIGVKVIHDAAVAVHVSGHACQEELKLMQALTKPKYFMPVHGEYKHMSANRDLALYMGMNPANIFISDIGKVLEIDRNGARFNGTVTAGRVLVDGYGVGDVGNIVLRDRRLLSQDGLIVVVATVSAEEGDILSGPDIVSRGFVYVRESEDLMEEMRKIALKSISDCLEKCDSADWFQIKGRVKDDLAKFILTKTKRKPMIIPMIMNI